MPAIVGYDIFRIDKIQLFVIFFFKYSNLLSLPLDELNRILPLTSKAV